METTIEQQVAMDEALVPSAQREMLHICPRIPGKSFAELPFEEEILDFIRFLGHSATIRTLTDVNINKLYQPWRSFAAIINKCLTGKTYSYDSLRLSQAQILWGLYHKRNVDYAFLIWEDFVYQVEHKNHKKSNEMCNAPLRKEDVTDDFMFSTIKLVSRHQTTQQFDAMLPIELTNEEIRNSKAYKEYYAIATGEAAPKPKANARRTRGGYDTFITPPTAIATPRPTATATPGLTAAVKGKQTAKVPKAKSLSALSEVAMTEAEQLKLVLKRSRQQMHISQPGGSGTDEGTGSKPGVPDVPTDESEEELSWNSSDDEGDEGNDCEEREEDDDEEDKDSNGSRDDDEVGKSNEEVDDEEIRVEESFDHIPHTPESSEDEGSGLQVTQEIEDSHVTLTPVHPDGQQESSSVSSQFVTSMLNLTSDAGMESIFETASTSVAPLPITAPTMTPSTIITTSQAQTLPTPIPSEVLQNLPNFASVFRFNNRLRSLEENFSEVMQTNQFAGAVSAILRIVQHFMDQLMNEAVQVAVQLQSDQLHKEAQKENDEFLRTVDENIKKIIKEQAKEQVKAQVSKILPRIEQAIILDTYGETVTLKRRRDDDEDKDEEPSVGPDRGSNRRREGKEPELASAPSEPATRSAGRGRKRQRFYGFAINRESTRDVYSKRRIITVIELKIVEWHSFKHLDWIILRQDDDNLYKFKEERFAFNVSLRMFIRSIVIQRRVEDLQLGVKSYQKKLNLTKPDTYWADLKHKEAYTAYSNPWGFIYQNKYKKNRLMWIDELHKFSDGTLTDVRTALDDRLKGIRMQYLP
nr:hypothetical protein [Tanacetum cinerariifolium]